MDDLGQDGNIETTEVSGEQGDGFEDWTPEDSPEIAARSGDDWTLPEEVENGWDDIEEQQFQDVPAGTYHVVVEKTEKKVSETSGSKMVSWELTIMEGDYKGRKLFKNHVFSSVKSRPFIKGDFAMCKIQLTAPLVESLNNNLGNLPGIMLKVKAKQQKGDYDGLNVNFVEYLGRMEESIE